MKKRRKYRVKAGRPMERREPEQLDAVQSSLREKRDGFSLAMSFDPGEMSNNTLTVHALDIMLGLLELRGWRRHGQEATLGPAIGWADRWWDRALGEHAFVIESDLVPGDGTNLDDITRIRAVTTLAWSMEREMYLRGGAMPDLLSAIAPEGVILGNVHPQPLGDAMRANRGAIVQRMATLPEPLKSASHAHVLIHLEGSTVQPWILPRSGHVCTFGTRSSAPVDDRAFIVLKDTAKNPRPETGRELLRLMLASGLDD